MLSTSSFRSLDPTTASTFSNRPPRSTGPVIYKHLRDRNETYTHREFIKLMKGKTSGLKLWHNHKIFLSDPENDTQEIVYALSASNEKNFENEKLLHEIYTSREFIREMSIPSEDFCGLDILEPGFVFDDVGGHKRIVTHCVAHPSKGEVLKKNGLDTSTALEVFKPLFQPLLEQKGRCSGIVKGDDSLFLEYIGLLDDILIDGSPSSRFYFLGFKARRLTSDLFVTTMVRKNTNPKRVKKSKKFKDALTDKEELQIYNLVSEELAIELSKDGSGRNLEDCRQKARDLFTDDTKPSGRSDSYIKYASEYLFKKRVYSKSTLTLGTMWLFDEFEKDQSAGIGAIQELSLSTNLKNFLQVIP